MWAGIPGVLFGSSGKESGARLGKESSGASPWVSPLASKAWRFRGHGTSMSFIRNYMRKHTTKDNSHRHPPGLEG